MDYQLEKGSSTTINSPKYLIAADQTEARARYANKANSVALFDDVDVRKNFVEIDGIRYPKDAIDLEYQKYIYRNHYRDPNNFCEEYVHELLLNPFTTNLI